MRVSPEIAEAIAQPTACGYWVPRLPETVKNPASLRRIEPGQLPALEPVLLVGEDLAHHVDQRPARGDEQALLAVGRKAHVARLERLAMRAGDRLLAEALDVERRLALALRQDHARVEGAGQHHVAQTLAQLLSASSEPAQAPTASPFSSSTRMIV